MKKALAISLSLVFPLCLLQAAALDESLHTDGERVLSAFGDVGNIAKQSKITIMDGTKIRCQGTLVSDDGLIVTKYSELEGAREPYKLVNKEIGRRFYRARLVAYDTKSDLADLRSNIRHKTGLKFGSSDGLEIGRWVVAGVDQSPGLHAGIVSAFIRNIPKEGGVIGVQLDDGNKSIGGVPVRVVVAGSPAQKAGLKRGDIIFAVNNKEIFTTQALIKAVTQYNPGEKVKVSLKRRGEKMDFVITLGYRVTVFDNPRMRNRNDSLSVQVSKRRSGFERVIQHDTTMTTADIGGPLLDLEGKLIGINIARANRVEFFAIPIEHVKQVLKENEKVIKESRNKRI